MSIKDIPDIKSPPKDVTEFISQGNQVREELPKVKRQLVAFTVNFPKDLLVKVDEKRNKKYMSRNSWLVHLCQKDLEQDM